MFITCRLIFAACGQAYIDNRVPGAQWPTLKPTTPFGQLPTLEIIEGNNVVYYAESHAIGMSITLFNYFDMILKNNSILRNL